MSERIFNSMLLFQEAHKKEVRSCPRKAGCLSKGISMGFINHCQAWKRERETTLDILSREGFNSWNLL